MGFLDLVHEYEKRIDHLCPIIDSAGERSECFQSDVDQIINSVFDLCASFERENFNFPDKIRKMKQFFIQRFRPYFRLGSYNRWVMDRPLGYAGDFYIIDEIYKNDPRTSGTERCMDRYFLNTEASVATRNRKEEFKRFLLNIVKARGCDNIRIMNLASGPCRDIVELCFALNGLSGSVILDCIDHDLRALDYGKKILDSIKHEASVNFLKKNAIRIALARDVHTQIPFRYDAIFSTGLFDYLNDPIAVRLIQNLKALLKEDGLLIISNYRDKWSNPSRYFMEWGGDWEIIYRTEEEFLRLFLEAGFKMTDLNIKTEAQKIMQYCFARRNG